MLTMMVLATTLCFGGVTYCVGRVRGYEQCEKDYDFSPSKSFWKDVKERGL